MKELFLLLLFFVGAASIPEYHGDRRFWTVVDSNGRTKIALHILKEPVNLVFPKDKTIAQLLSDMKLLSPSGNVQCQDTTNTLGFTLLFDDQNHIRGEIEMELDVGGQKVKMFLYQKCGVTELPNDYATGMIEDTELSFENPGRTCFKNGEPPFRPHGTNAADNVMELKVSPGAPGAFGCQVFMILPGYMLVEDGPLPKARVNPLNSTFAERGDEYWWKKEAHEWLPSAVSFVDEDVKINIRNSSKASPLYFRIGNNSVIPTFKFAFPPSCNSFKTELFLNFHDKPECKIGIEITQAGFMFSTTGAPAKEIKDAAKSPSLVFDETKNLVYVKVENPLSVNAFDTCTMAKSASDQLVVQIAPGEGGQCDSADVTLNRNDIERSIDVLIDRAKIVEPNVIIATNGTENTTIAAVVSAATTQESADAGFQWWWVVVPVGLLFVLLLAILITYLCIRRRRRNQKPKPTGPPPRSIFYHDNEDQPKSPDAIPAESPKKKKKNKKDGKLDESSKGSKKSKKEKPQPPKPKPSQREKVDLYENLPPPMIQKQPQKPAIPRSDRTQTEPTGDPTIETGTTQADSQQNVPGTVEKAKPRPKLKYRSMYGAGGFGQMDQPFDYHLNEGSEYEPTINFSAAKTGSTPQLQQFPHFWACIEPLSIAKRYSGIYVNSKVLGKNIYFMIRDCVAEDSKYSAFRTLANRMLEPLSDANAAAEKKSGSEQSTTIDGDKKCFVLRIFILSYEPLTMEIHCRGQCPLFLFYIFECEQCPQIGERLQKNAWLNSQSTCNEDWNTFVCRVKRTPLNTHQFLSYAGPEKPKNSDEVNHVMVVRGNKKPNQLRDCIRGCKFSDKSHANNMTIENDLDGGDPTLQTQVTQPSSKELKS